MFDNEELEILEALENGSLKKSINADEEIALAQNAAKEYRSLWKRDVCESVEIEEYGFNEFLGGKAEGFEESLEILKEYMAQSYR